LKYLTVRSAISSRIEGRIISEISISQISFVDQILTIYLIDVNCAISPNFGFDLFSQGLQSKLRHGT
jgi:hypothetical protein